MLSQIILFAAGITACMAQQPLTTNATTAQTIGVEAYVYFYPLVSMEVTRYQTTVTLQRPMNKFLNAQTFPTASSTTIVRPNFDTLYSTSWVDLTQGGVILSLPDTSGRYYLMPMLDMWTDVFAVPGKRTSGTTAVKFVIAMQGCTGGVANSAATSSSSEEGELEVIYSPTPYVWIIGRTQTNGAADYNNVYAIQAQYGLSSASGLNCPAVNNPGPPSFISSLVWTQKPLSIVNGLTAQQYFTYSSYLLNFNGMHVTDWSQVDRLSQIGIVPGKQFNWNALSSDVQSALANAVTVGLQTIANVSSVGALVNGWNMNIKTAGVYGNDYATRAYTAEVGLGANQLQDAIYPFLMQDANGNGLVGSTCYTLTFAAGQTPPTTAFWSVTMYNAAGYPVSNPINRYALHNWDTQNGMTYNADGSLTLIIQANQPAASVGNWLPAPSTGGLGITMRVYAPTSAMSSGSWSPPQAIPGACQ